MAIDFKKEKKCELKAQDQYDIIGSSIECSYDDGFMNSFVFERALYSFALVALGDDDAEVRIDQFNSVKTNPLLFFEDHLEEIEKLFQEKKETLDILAETAATWFEDYTEYAYSTRGMLDNLGDIMNGVTQRAQDELIEMQDNGEFQQILDIAKNWGMDREVVPAISDKVVETETEEESLFE